MAVSDVKNIRWLSTSARGIVWTYDRNQLRTYSFSGDELFDLPVDVKGTNISLVVNSVDGSLWVAGRKTLQHVNAERGTGLQITLERNVRALALDESALRLWVGTENSVFAVDAVTGVELLRLTLGKKDKVKSIAVDAATGDVWVGLPKKLRRYTDNGARLLEIDVKRFERVASGLLGGVPSHFWVRGYRASLMAREISH